MTEVTYPDEYQPTVDVADWRRELEDIHALLRAAGHNGPLRDTVPFAIGKAERIKNTLKEQCSTALENAYRAERGEDYLTARAYFNQAATLVEALAAAEGVQ